MRILSSRLFSTCIAGLNLKGTQAVFLLVFTIYSVCTFCIGANYPNLFHLIYPQMGHTFKDGYTGTLTALVPMVTAPVILSGVGSPSLTCITDLWYQNVWLVGVVKSCAAFNRQIVPLLERSILEGKSSYHGPQSETFIFQLLVHWHSVSAVAFYVLVALAPDFLRESDAGMY